MSSVLQPWVDELPWKQQSILFSGLRGPDQEYLVNIKQVSKWMRSVTQQNADPSKPYMNGINLPALEDLEHFYKELEHCPCHFVHHFADALAIIGYAHPEQEVSLYAAGLHYSIAEEVFHFIPESPAVFWMRHRDKRDGNDPEAVTWRHHEEAMRRGYMSAVNRRFVTDPPSPHVIKAEMDHRLERGLLAHAAQGFSEFVVRRPGTLDERILLAPKAVIKEA
jgi:hypothetical protein